MTSRYCKHCVAEFPPSKEMKTGFINGVKRTVCEVWTRAMGYCRPVSCFNKGKQSEFKERKYFTEEKSISKKEK